jgi:OmpA-OmpF porin, OOP family
MFTRLRFFNPALIIIIACLTTLFVANATGQEVKTVLFQDANKSMSAAREAHADLLAPKNFEKAMKYYKEAEDKLKKGENLDDIRKNLRESSAYFQKALEATKIAEVTFPNSIKARKDAKYTEAAKFSSKRWTEAEKKFNEAAIKLEDGDLNESKKKADEAEKLYRHAELETIAINYLQGSRELLKQADKLKVKDHAPKTLQQAQQLVNQAEKELNENRYDNDVARSLAQRANYEAKHAIYLANTIKQMKDNDQSWEDLMLASEKPLRQIAEISNLSPSFDTGLGKTTDAIIKYVTIYQDSVIILNQDLAWYNQELYLRLSRIEELEKQFGSQVQEKSALTQQIARQAKTRELFNKIDDSFSPEEARIFREGDDIIIRLVGLTFPSAKSTIEQKSFGLLTKVLDASNSFPECTISVLGHTDSYGGDAQNLQLSKERAEAVKQYIIANSNIVDSQIKAIGYGESKPIATNETEAGRAANRRVDVVIHPHMGEQLSQLD